MALDSSEIHSLSTTVLCISPCHSPAAAGWNIDQSHPALRSNLFSNSANRFMEWPQSQCLQVQVAQRLSIQIRICRDLWQQISPCQQQEGKIKLLPSLGSSSVVLSQAELPWIIPSWSRAGSALSQDWTIWVLVVAGTKPSSSKAGLFRWLSLSPWGSALGRCYPPLQVNYPPNPLSWLPHGIFSSWQRTLCSAAHRNAHNPTISVTGVICTAFQLCIFPQLICRGGFCRWEQDAQCLFLFLSYTNTNGHRCCLYLPLTTVWRETCSHILHYRIVSAWLAAFWVLTESC